MTGGRRVRPRLRSSRTRRRRSAPRPTSNPAYRRSSWSGSSWVPPPSSTVRGSSRSSTRCLPLGPTSDSRKTTSNSCAACARRGVGGRHAVRRRRACREQRGPASSRGLVPGVRCGTRPRPTRARRDAARGAPRAWRAHVRDGAASGRPSGGLPRGGCAIGRLDRGRRTDRRTGRRDRRSHACRCDRSDRGLVTPSRGSAGGHHRVRWRRRTRSRGRECSFSRDDPVACGCRGGGHGPGVRADDTSVAASRRRQESIGISVSAGPRPSSRRPGELTRGSALRGLSEAARTVSAAIASHGVLQHP